MPRSSVKLRKLSKVSKPARLSSVRASDSILSRVGRNFQDFLIRRRRRKHQVASGIQPAKPKRQSRLGTFFSQLSEKIPVPRWLSNIKLPKFKGNIVLLVVLGGILFAVFAVISRIAEAPLGISDQVAEGKPAAIVGDTINIMVAMYEQPDRYEFVDFVGLLSINKREAKGNLVLINIDPELSTSVLDNAPIKFRNLLSAARLAGKPGVSLLTQSIQTLTAVKVDRYLLIEKSAFASYLDSINYRYFATDDVTDPEAGTYLVGDEISGGRIMQYLAADTKGSLARSARISKFLTEFVGRNLTVPGYLSSYNRLEALGSMVKTDLSKNEIFELGINLLNRGDLTYGFVSTAYGRYVESKQGGYFLPDYLAVDQLIQQLLSRTRVVREQARVEIFNASNKTGIATTAKRQLMNQGANIIRAGNSPEKSSQNTLYVSDVERFSANIALVREIMRGDVEILQEPYPFNHTGDLVLVLGGD